MTVQGSAKRDEAIIAAKSSAPFPILMAFFMLIYAVWWAGVGRDWLGYFCATCYVCGLADFSWRECCACSGTITAIRANVRSKQDWQANADTQRVDVYSAVDYHYIIGRV